MQGKLDVNGDGKIDIEDIIIIGMKTPGIRIKRAEFLRNELMKNYSESVIEDAIAYNPAHAGITVMEIDKIAEEVIKFERACVSGISAALGAPGGAAGANNAIKGIAKALSTGVEKKLMQKALTKGTIYPIVKSVSKWFGVKMTKDVFAGFFKKAIPIIGGVIGGV